ncbi:MAG: phosphoglycerate kinase, partial [Candidatus Sungbacteria bacterium]|nr:phosphoglycerate kinase [Candidatus Sungbacteria bacterium]
MFLSLKSIGDVKGKKVLVRVDFNVPIKEGEVPAGSEWRLKAVLPTLDYLAQAGAKIILIAHLGRPQGYDLHYSLYPVFEKLKKIWPVDLSFSHDILGPAAEREINNLKNGGAVLLENLRFYKEEEANDETFAKSLSAYGDVFVNDAFAASHRAHASIIGLPKFLKSYAGFLLEKEIAVLSMVRSKPRRPLVLVMGGAKADTKLKLVKEFLDKSDGILLGGILANTLLYARGLAVGKSMVDENLVNEAKKMNVISNHMHLPVDVTVSKSLTRPDGLGIRPIGRIGESEFIIDIGPDSTALFEKIIKSARMIIWNGSLGLTEVPAFKKGSLAVAKALAESRGEKIIGGGDLISFLTEESLIDKMTYVSTGGGAMLEF